MVHHQPAPHPWPRVLDKNAEAPAITKVRDGHRGYLLSQMIPRVARARLGLAGHLTAAVTAPRRRAGGLLTSRLGQVHQRRHISPSCNSEAAPALEKARLDYSGHGHSALAPCPLNYGANQGLRWVPGCGRYQLLLATNTTACNFEGFCLGVRGYGAGPGLQLAPNSNSD